MGVPGKEDVAVMGPNGQLILNEKGLQQHYGPGSGYNKPGVAVDPNSRKVVENARKIEYPGPWQQIDKDLNSKPLRFPAK